MWGPPAPIPTSQWPHAGLTHSGERRSTRKESSQVRDQKTVHNQWMRTIAISLNTLRRLYNYTRPNRARTIANRPKPYHTAGVQVSASCVSESGAAPHTTSEGSLEAMEPFPGLAGVKSSKEECRLPSRSHRSAYRQGAIHYESHPAPPPLKKGQLMIDP
jgi:hypothetical protein